MEKENVSDELTAHNLHLKQIPYTTARIGEGRGRTVSIGTQGRIGLRYDTIFNYSITAGTRVHLYYDEAKASIALSFTHHNDPSAYPVYFIRRTYSNAVGAYIPALRFFKHANLDLVHYAGRYPYVERRGGEVDLPEVDSVLLVDLAHPTSSS